MPTIEKQIMKTDPAIWDKVVSVELTVAEAHQARAACRRQSRKYQRFIDSSSFVPEPGKRDSNALRVEVLNAATVKFAAVVDAALGKDGGS